MEREELIRAAESAGFSCSDREIRDLTRERLLKVMRREGKGRKIIIHDEADRLRLLAILGLRRPLPHGLDVNRFEKLRSWLGAVNENPIEPEALTALTYILGVYGIDVEEARRAAVEYLERERKRLGRGLLQQIENAFFPAMGFIFVGCQAYQQPGIYEIADSHTIVAREVIDGAAVDVIREEKYTLRDEIASFVPPGLQGYVGADSLAQFARVIDPRQILEKLESEDPDRLRAAAVATRTLFGPLFALAPPPYAAATIYAWAFFVSLISSHPPAEMMVAALERMPEPMFVQLAGALESAARFALNRRTSPDRAPLAGDAAHELAPGETDSGNSNLAH